MKCPRCGKVFEKDEYHLMCSDCGFQLSIRKLESREKVLLILKRTLKSIKIFVLTIVILAFLFSIYGIFHWVKNNRIGEICDNGGIIFFDKCFYSNGWRYLAVAPENFLPSHWANKKIEGMNVPSEKIGAGDQNTSEIIEILGAKTIAYRVSMYDYTSGWYLGNVKEMKLLRNFVNSSKFKNMENSLESFGPFSLEDEEGNVLEKKYWTSEYNGDNQVYVIDFSDKKRKPFLEYITDIDEQEKSALCYARPICKF